MTEPMNGRRIAIVGGAGFIGHNLALSLAARGAKVEVVDSLQVNNLLTFSGGGPTPHRDLYLRMIRERLDLMNASGISVRVQDARDYHALSRVLSEISPQVIIHLAAVSHAGKSNKDPFSTFDHSLRTLENALDYARGGVEHFIFLSSSMVYGNFLVESVPETHELNPIGIYGALKLAGEKMVIAYEQVFKLPYTIIRPSALYGPRCVSRRVGQIFIENALNNDALKVDGDGSEKLDFTYIDDLVDGIALAILRPEARNEIFNITYGSSRPIRDLVDILRREFGSLKVEHVERDALMPFRGTLSIEKSRRLIGFEPKNPIDIGFPKYVQWYRQLMAVA
jgi:nucleoside-diphosphate-sugar epimerase